MVYKQFIDLLNINPKEVYKIVDIPFLPIEFFKSHKVVSTTAKIEQTFLSSGTTGMQQSKHYVSDVSLYKESYLNGFNYFYGNIENYTILALLPAYLEREGSSLIYMVDDLIKKSKKPKSGFYLDNLDNFFSMSYLILIALS